MKVVSLFLLAGCLSVFSNLASAESYNRTVCYSEPHSYPFHKIEVQRFEGVEAFTLYHEIIEGSEPDDVVNSWRFSAHGALDDEGVAVYFSDTPGRIVARQAAWIPVLGGEEIAVYGWKGRLATRMPNGEVGYIEPFYCQEGR